MILSHLLDFYTQSSAGLTHAPARCDSLCMATEKLKLGHDSSLKIQLLIQSKP